MKEIGALCSQNCSIIIKLSPSLQSCTACNLRLLIMPILLKAPPTTRVSGLQLVMLHVTLADAD